MKTNSILKEIPIEDISPDEDQPRRKFDPEALNDLAHSIRAQGVLQPILVRPTGRKKSPFKLIAGERRLRASKLAGLTTIPAMVADPGGGFEPETLVEIQLVENIQREGLHPLEEAEALRMLKARGRSVDELAETLGKSKGTIYASLKLVDLKGKARTAFLKGELETSVAILIARIGSPKTADDITDRVLNHWGGPLGVRAVRDLIQEDYARELKGAPFDQEDGDLIINAGACSGCLDRSGNCPEWIAGRGDICLDPACFKAKVDATVFATLEDAKAKGKKIAKTRPSKHVLLTEAPSYMDVHSHYGKKWGALTKGQKRPEGVRFVEKTGHIATAYPIDEMKTAARKNGVKFADRAAGRNGSPRKTEAPTKPDEGNVVAAALLSLRDDVIRAAREEMDTVDVLRLVFTMFEEMLEVDAWAPRFPDKEPSSAQIQELLEKATEEEVREIIVDAFFMGTTWSLGSRDRDAIIAATGISVDFKAVMKAERDRLTKEMKAAAKAAAAEKKTKKRSKAAKAGKGAS